MKPILKVTFNCLFCIAIISCDTQSSESSKSKSDTIIKDIPKSFNTTPFRNLKNDILTKAGLSDIDNGFDSLQIRVWYGYVFMHQDQLLILKNQNHKWSGQFYDLFYNYADKDSLVSIKKQERSVSPASGWSNFINNIYKLDVLILPDRSKIPGYSADADGDGVTVEIATSDKYRIYNYQSPGGRQNEIPEAKKMESIMQLIEDELGVKRLRKF